MQFSNTEIGVELVVALVVFGVGLAVLAGHSGIMKSASGLLRFAPSWFKRILFGDHVMWVAVGFFAVMLVVLTKAFGP